MAATTSTPRSAGRASLFFDKLTVTYYPKVPNGQAGNPVTATYDFSILG